VLADLPKFESARDKFPSTPEIGLRYRLSFREARLHLSGHQNNNINGEGEGRHQHSIQSFSFSLSLFFVLQYLSQPFF
jgi:hypothetical protein